MTIAPRTQPRAVALALTLALCCAGLFAACSTDAQAASDLKIGYQDDSVVFSPSLQNQTLLNDWRDVYGVSYVRINAVWRFYAPAFSSRTKPAGFNASNPNDTHYNWAKLDDAVNQAAAAGMKITMAVTGGGPVWTSQVPARGSGLFKPNPAEYAQYATAVARRYGNKVDTYLIWNEPNQPGWLQPQSNCKGSKCTPEAPHIYRKLALAGYPAIKAVDPSAKVLIGMLAPIGSEGTKPNGALKPMPFLRAMGCVDDNFRSVRTGSCRGFKAPAGDSFGYHPYPKNRPPGRPNPDTESAQMSDLKRVTNTLDKMTARHRLRSVGSRKFLLDLTEYGIHTSPPYKSKGVATLTQQDQRLQESAYIAWANPRVKSLMFYQWRDSVQLPGEKVPWSTGLLFSDGRVKPSLENFDAPFWVDIKPGSRKARAWGQVRAGGGHTVSLWQRGRGGNGEWQKLRTVRTNSLGYFTSTVSVSFESDIRFSWDQGKRVEYSGTFRARISPKEPDASTSKKKRKR